MGFTEADNIAGTLAAVLLDGGVVFSCCVYILVAEDVRNKINVACRSVKAGPVGAAQLMRRDLFE